MGKLYLVATPIGNLEDISARALRLLREAACIAAEDTRTTGKLLAHYGIRTPMLAYHEHNKLVRIEAVLERLAAGDVALVSDAGTPGLNDPGYELVRAALAAGFEVCPVPGPCAPVAALAASGLPTNSFIYLGYLPRKSAQRKALLAELTRERRTLIALETPHRLMESLEDIQAVLGDRPLAVARELTKLHEEFVRGSVADAREAFPRSSAARGNHACHRRRGRIGTLDRGGNPVRAAARSQAQPPGRGTRRGDRGSKRVEQAGCV